MSSFPDWQVEGKRPAYRRLLISQRTFQNSEIASIRLCDLTTRDFQDYVAELIDEEYENLRQQCKRVCAEAGVPYLGLHVWRHTFASNLYYKGVDVKILSKLLGHANTTITYNIYIHLYRDGFDDMMKAVS